MKLWNGLTALSTAAVTLSALPTAIAWGAAGHEIVATIAQIYLHPTALANVCDILYPGSSSSDEWPPCHISRVATWADQVRRQPQYRYTASMHYVGARDDHPSDSCAFPGEKGWAGRKDVNVLGAVRNMTNVLVGYTDGYFDLSTAEEATKFLIHYLGDMHMPLHLTGRERGGNGVRVTFDGRITNLHSLWDGLLIAQALRSLPYNYTRPFPRGSTSVDVETHLTRNTIYDPYVRRVLWEGLGVGNTPGRFEPLVENWLSCPAKDVQDRSFWNTMQTTLGMRRVADEDRWDDDVLCPFAWAKDLHELNCALPVWPAELDMPPYNETRARFNDDVDGHDHEEEFSDFLSRPPRPHPDLLELDTPEYAGKIREEWIVERLMATAGVRLAGILNGLFMDAEGLEDGCIMHPVVFVDAHRKHTTDGSE